jgi:hypothetical protein
MNNLTLKQTLLINEILAKYNRKLTDLLAKEVSRIEY